MALEEIGQSTLIGELYKDNAVFIKNVPDQLLAEVILKLTGDARTRPEFNPKLLAFFTSVSTFQGSFYERNLGLIAKLITRPGVFETMLYLKKNPHFIEGVKMIPIENKENRQRLFISMGKWLLELNFMKILVGNVPYLYHSSLFALLIIIYRNHHEGENLLKPKLLQHITINYIFYFLSKSDRFTKIGEKGKLVLILKVHLARLALAVHL
jgi:hypothetical protein